jgi:hypothetical protein
MFVNLPAETFLKIIVEKSLFFNQSQTSTFNVELAKKVYRNIFCAQFDVPGTIPGTIYFTNSFATEEIKIY